MSTKKRKAAVVDGGDPVQGSSDQQLPHVTPPASTETRPLESRQPLLAWLATPGPPTLGDLQEGLRLVSQGAMDMDAFMQMIDAHRRALAAAKARLVLDQAELQRLRAITASAVPGIAPVFGVAEEHVVTDTAAGAAAAPTSAAPAAPPPVPLGAGPGQQALPGAAAGGPRVSTVIRNSDGTKTPVVPSSAAVVIDRESWTRMWSILRRWATKHGLPLDLQDEEIRTYIHRQAGVLNTRHVPVEAYKQLVEVEGAEARFVAAVAPDAGRA